MANLVASAKEQITEIVKKAYSRCVADGTLPEGADYDSVVEIPKDTKFGDYATNFAMMGAKHMHMAPRKIADALIANIDLDNTYFSSCSVAGAGFINFTLSGKWYREVLEKVEQEGDSFARGDIGGGKKVMVEFVSANPTGPMHMGNARGGVLGDTLASVLDACGYDVWREFYVNDAGNQIEKFAQSIEARYFQIIKGEDVVPFPEDGYHGDDIKALARDFYETYGESYMDKSVEERHAAMSQFGLERNIPKMQKDLARYKINYDKWFFESELHSSGYVEETVAKLTENGYTYEKDGALWLKTAQILRENQLKVGKTPEEVEKLDLKDDVLRRANGFFTYFAADIAYHRTKLEKRGFDKAINVWGADHHGHVARLKGALDALGLNGSERLDIVLMQLVRLMRDGEVVRMSKRTGKAISLSDLLDEIPVDAARYFFNAKPESQMDFDMGLAVRQDSENPVYYVQYAHARICRLVDTLAQDGYSVKKTADIDVSLLNDELSLDLIKQISILPEEIRLAARDYDPSRINRYLTELATKFHRFYNANKVRGEEDAVLNARLKLADTVREVIRIALGIIDVTAPEKM